MEGATGVDGRTPTIWDAFCARPDSIADGTNGDVACDQYHQYRSDVVTLGGLGLTGYRLSIAWSRIVDEVTRRVNPAGLSYYDRLVDELLAADIRPYPTSYHWDLPQFLSDRGGWLNRDTALRFADYAEVMTDVLGDRIQTWTTINDPPTPR